MQRELQIPSFVSPSARLLSHKNLAARRPWAPLRLLQNGRAAMREMDSTTIVAVLLQWIAAAVLAVSLVRANVVALTGMRTVLLIAASISGPLTCLGILRAGHRMRKYRFKQQSLMHRTLHDELTGLPNRASMREHLQQALAEAHATTSPLTCLYLDLDGVRFANTLLGYPAGDELLKEIVRRVDDCLAPTDYFCRFGGDKFVILLHRPLTRAGIDAFADAVIHSVARPFLLNQQEFSTGVSIGIAAFPTSATHAEGLLAAAERAMYAVKHSGRSTFRHADREDSAADARKRLLADKLQAALYGGKLRLEYQPIFSTDGVAVAVEALCRWQDADEGNISPGEFIPIAEATGMIVPLSKWVLYTACEQMQSWLARGSSLRRIAVNICVLQASRDDFFSTVQETLRETKLPPEYLELEVTESALAIDFEAVRQHVQQLRALGIRIAIDDFGTGYSSFGRLRDLEVDAFKIDRLFVQGADETPNGVAVLEAIVDMAHRLQLTVVAEGVETNEQLQMLRRMSCDEMQGFFLARPQTPFEVSKLVAPVQPRQQEHRRG